MIDVTNGDIIALASAPGFDPNSFVFGISSAEWNGAARRRLPAARRTRPSPGAYPPGSTFKIVHGAGGARGRRRRARATPSTAPASPTLGNRRFHCWKRGGHGTRRPAPQPRRSPATATTTRWRGGSGPTRSRDGAPARARASRHDLPMPAVAEGNMPDASLEEGQRATRPGPTGDSFNYGIGQGFTLASPLQLAVMTARVASGTRGDAAARARRSTAWRSRRGAGGRSASTRSTCTRCATGCTRSRTRAPPTARASSTRRCMMAGKTGTSQVRIITAAERAARRHLERAAALGAARPRALRRLRALRQAALRRRADRRARRRRLGGGGADRARHPAVRALRRAAAARGLSGRAAQGASRSSGAAPKPRPTPAAGAGPRDRA